MFFLLLAGRVEKQEFVILVVAEFGGGFGEFRTHLSDGGGDVGCLAACVVATTVAVRKRLVVSNPAKHGARVAASEGQRGGFQYTCLLYTSVLTQISVNT